MHTYEEQIIIADLVDIYRLNITENVEIKRESVESCLTIGVNIFIARVVNSNVSNE